MRGREPGDLSETAAYQIQPTTHNGGSITNIHNNIILSYPKISLKRTSTIITELSDVKMVLVNNVHMTSDLV